MSAVSIRSYVRGILRGAFAEGPDQPNQMTPGGELLVVQGLPPEAELARQGVGWATIGTAVAPVAAIPTTAAHFSLYNGDPTKSLIIAAVGGFSTTSMAVAGQISMLVRNDVPGFNAAISSSLIITGLSGKLYGGKAVAKASQTLGAIGASNNVAWMPVGMSASAITTTTIGVVAHAECYGRWIVQPGGYFSVATIAQTAAGTVQPYIYFYEANLLLP
jgi:hypothetical protein